MNNPRAKIFHMEWNIMEVSECIEHSWMDDVPAFTCGSHRWSMCSYVSAYTYLSDPHLNQWKLGGIIVLSAALCIISYATSTTALPEIRKIQTVIITQRDRRHKACLVVLTDIDNATGKSGTERVASWIILFRFSYVVASQHRQRNGSHVEFNYLGNSPSLDNHRQRQRRPG